mmetsp:Transcript_20142/g.47539  ORF Transcript_20142/g.47539 Transcript_20142/m.47539 type:complete len:119 (+) Transcript_20142:219-575(+)
MAHEKSRTTAWLLWLCLGWMGAHRYYLGQHCSGIAFTLTIGVCVVGWLLDAFNINGLVDDYNEHLALAPLLERDSAGHKLTYTQPAMIVRVAPDEPAEEAARPMPLPPPVMPTMAAEL